MAFSTTAAAAVAENRLTPRPSNKAKQSNANKTKSDYKFADSSHIAHRRSRQSISVSSNRTQTADLQRDLEQLVDATRADEQMRYIAFATLRRQLDR